MAVIDSQEGGVYLNGSNGGLICIVAKVIDWWDRKIYPLIQKVYTMLQVIPIIMAL